MSNLWLFFHSLGTLWGKEKYCSSRPSEQNWLWRLISESFLCGAWDRSTQFYGFQRDWLKNWKKSGSHSDSYIAQEPKSSWQLKVFMFFKNGAFLSVAWVMWEVYAYLKSTLKKIFPTLYWKIHTRLSSTFVLNSHSVCITEKLKLLFRVCSEVVLSSKPLGFNFLLLIQNVRVLISRTR